MRTDETNGDDPPAGIRPLTHRTGDGTVYRRPAAIEQQIVGALALARSELLAVARIRDTATAGYLSDESLVYFLREYGRRGDTEGVNRLAEALIRRVAPVLNTRLSRLGPYAEDAYADAIRDLFERLLDYGSDRADYYQIRFGSALKRLAITTFNRHLRAKLRAQESVPLAATAEEHEDEGRSQTLDLADPSLSAEEWTLYREGLASLPDHLREALVLGHYEGWPIEDQDPTVPTISRYFDKTPRTIRNWLREAEVLLERWRGVQQ